VCSEWSWVNNRNTEQLFSIVVCNVTHSIHQCVMWRLYPHQLHTFAKQEGNLRILDWLLCLTLLILIPHSLSPLYSTSYTSSDLFYCSPTLRSKRRPFSWSAQQLQGRQHLITFWYVMLIGTSGICYVIHCNRSTLRIPKELQKANTLIMHTWLFC